ncbi:MAG: protein kinase domain-containing protein [Deltaproteobacteria bacterium]
MTMDYRRWQRIGAIFDEVAEMPFDARSGLLARLCAGDTELRAEVERMLAADARATRFEHGVDVARGSVAADWADAENARVHERAGPWRLLRELGRGGMGVVWLAERADGAFEQRAALKLIKRGMDSDAVQARFLRERQILALLDHPHIAHLLDGGIGADGRPYFAMEYVDGEPLLDHAAKHELSVQARLALFADICTAVQFAHGRLVVHRDIKPSNILVTAAGEVKLLDFGIAKLLDDTTAGATATSDLRPLTPAYAAPEQLRGEAATTASDIYALGCVLYELLTGKRPLASGNTPTPEQMLRLQESSDPAAPSNAADSDSPVSARRMRGDLDTIALKALQRDPSRRYATAAALADDVQRYLSGRPIAARRDSAAYRLRKFVGRHRIAVPAAVASIAGLLAATAISLHEAQIARVQTLQARAQATRAQATREFLVGVFDQVSPDANKGQPITARQLLQTGEREVGKESDRQPAVKAELSALLGRLYRDIGDRPHGRDLIERALAQISAADIPLDVRAGVLLSAAETESEDKETYAAALAHAREAVALLENTPGADPQALAQGHVRIAYALRHTDADPEAASVLRRAIAEDSRALGDNDAVAEEWVQFGIVLADLKRFVESGAAFDHALRIYGNLYGTDSTHVAHALDAMGGMRVDARDYAGAESAYRKALRIYAEKLDPGNHDALVVKNNLLRVLEMRGNFAEALPARLALLEQGRASGQLTPTDLANDYLGVGIDYVETSAFADGERMFRDALDVLRTKPGTHSAWYAFGLEFLGYDLPWEGRYAEAERAFRDALVITLEKEPSTSASACRLRDSLSWVLDLQHRYAEALALARQVDADCTAKLPDDSTQLPTFLADLSAAQLDNNDAASAADTAHAAVMAARKVYPPAYYRLGVPLLALARADLALERAGEAEPLLREALAVRSPPYAADDPRVLEVEVELVAALGMDHKRDEAEALRARIEPVLKHADSVYLHDLLARLQKI